MKKAKLTSILTALLMLTSGFCMNAPADAAVDPESLPSVADDLDKEFLAEWDAALLQCIGADCTDLTLSEPYHAYDFSTGEHSRNGDQESLSYYRLVFSDGELYAIASTYCCQECCDNGYHTSSWFYTNPDEYTFLTDALDNGSKILFGSAYVNSLPCSMVYIDGIVYAYNSAAYPQGATDFVFGEITSSLPTGDIPTDEDGVYLPGATTKNTGSGLPTGLTLYGDANSDGEISLKDVVTIQRAVAGAVQLTGYQQLCSDCCCDGVINASDVTALMKFIVEAIDSIPVYPE